MLRAVLVGMALVLALLGGSAQGRRQTDAPCHDYDELRRQLARGYGEHPVSSALAPDGRLVQVFASPELGTWTMLSVAEGGAGCVIATGRAWEVTEPALGAQGRSQGFLDLPARVLPVVIAQRRGQGRSRCSVRGRSRTSSATGR